MQVIEINHLKKYYGKNRGVEDVSLHVDEGEIFGFIGPNGAGKSTTIRCALSLIFPTSGEIKIFGKDSVKDRVEIARQVGYLPGEVFYYDNMTVKELLNYSASFYGKVNTKERDELCELLELDPSKKIEDLSLGNKKKVGIIQGLAHKPRLIILDEPTSGLDPLMQQRFFKLIEERRNQGATVLFSSHILSEIKRLSDRIAIIRNGQIEDINSVMGLESNAYKNIQIQAPEDNLVRLDHFSGLEQKLGSPGERHYLYRGDIATLLRELNLIQVLNLTIEDPSLEEIFMHYYE
ncbi:MAG: ABC transporter ATP-binding protein [Clostridiaceae bacterium]